MDHQISPVVFGSGVPVDEDQAVATVVIDETGSGVHRQAGTRHDEQVGVVNGVDAVFDGLMIQTFFVEHHIGLHDAAAVTAGYALSIPDKFGRMEFTALHAVIPEDGAVEFVDPLGYQKPA